MAKEPNFFGGSTETAKEVVTSVGKGLVILGAAIVASSAIQAATGAFSNNKYGS